MHNIRHSSFKEIRLKEGSVKESSAKESSPEEGRIKDSKALNAISVLILTLSLAQLSQAMWIHAKATLAQHLIQRSWQQSLSAASIAELEAASAEVAVGAAELVARKPWPWADTWPVARLQYTGIAEPQDLYVLAGAQGNSLAFGPGHMHGSVLPGTEGVSIIGGHRDTHFAFLEQVAQGDVFTVTPAQGATRHYIVTATQVADSLSEPLLAMPYASQLLLVTCYPFDAITPGSLRYVVTAELIQELAQAEQRARAKFPPAVISTYKVSL